MENTAQSALEHNIKSKGEFSYYYAHGRKFENKNDEKGQIIEGPGIITGGDPVLLQQIVKEKQVFKEPKKFTKYIFYDDDRFAVMKIDLPAEIKDLVNNECINFNIQERAFDLKVDVPDGEPYFYSIKKLFAKVIPEECTAKIHKEKVTLKFKKKKDDEEWTSLNAA
jgi:hypothetical protein